MTILKHDDFLYFQYVDLYGFEQSGRLVGFVGVAGNGIEMLFMYNDFWGRGKGIGKELITYAIGKLQVCKADVNEQNPQATYPEEHTRSLSGSL